MWQTFLAKAKAWCLHSATIAWGYFKILAGTILLAWHEIFDYLGDALRDTDVKQALAAMNFPAYVGLGLIVIGFITRSVRLRGKEVTEDNKIVEATDVPV